MQTSRGVLALAFSGGLDTSYCVPRLAEAGWTVHTVFVNTGGSTPAQRAAIRAQAQAVGAVQHHEVDARQLVYDRFVRYLVQGNVLRGEVYPLSVAAERTQQALSVLELARTIGAKAIAHGSTGAGNDQIRFDIALRVLAPDLEIVTPIREGSVRREESIAYLKARVQRRVGVVRYVRSAFFPNGISFSFPLSINSIVSSSVSHLTFLLRVHAGSGFRSTLGYTVEKSST